MHEKVQQKFFGTILQWMRSCRVGHGPRLDDYGDMTIVGRLLELEQEYLHRWMPVFAVVVEVAQRIQLRLLGIGVTNPAEGQAITLEEALGRDNVESVAKACVDFLASIPYPSTFWTQLRGIELALPEPIGLGPFRLRNVGDAHATPKNALLANLLAGNTPPRVALAANDIALEISVTGYSRQTMADSSPIQALSLVKEFVVLAEAVDVLVRDTKLKFQEPTPLLAELAGDPQKLEWIDNVPPNAARHVDSYTLAEDVLRIRPIQGGLLAGAFPGRELTAEERATEVRSRLARLERVFDTQADKHVMSLRAAAQWYFDSLAESNETTAFLFVSLGLEALLGGDRGETEGVGLKKLLANRLAYLLGGDRATRERIIGEFQGFYNKRSDLVHGRELRLDRVSQQWLLRGREWLRQAIHKEVSALLLPPPSLALLRLSHL